MGVGDTVLSNVKKEKIRSEHLEQVHFVSRFRKGFPGVRIFAIPNGGKRGIREAARLKLEGVSAGVPDLYVPEWRLWIEMKRVKGGRVDPAQSDWHRYLREIGDAVIVCAGEDDAWAQVQGFLHSRADSVEVT